MRNPPASDPFWIHVAHHEAGHAFAKLLAARELHRNDNAFDDVRIRPGATRPHKDRRGRDCDCAGCVQGWDYYSAIGLAEVYRADERMRLFLIRRATLEFEISVAGPMAECVSHGCTSKRQMRHYGRFSEGFYSDWSRAWKVFDELCVLHGRRLNAHRYLDVAREKVLQGGSAIAALAVALMDRRKMTCSQAVAVMAPHIAA